MEFTLALEFTFSSQPKKCRIYAACGFSQTPNVGKIEKGMLSGKFIRNVLN